MREDRQQQEAPDAPRLDHAPARTAEPGAMGWAQMWWRPTMCARKISTGILETVVDVGEDGERAAVEWGGGKREASSACGSVSAAARLGARSGDPHGTIEGDS